MYVVIGWIAASLGGDEDTAGMCACGHREGMRYVCVYVVTGWSLGMCACGGHRVDIITLTSSGREGYHACVCVYV